MSVDTWTIDSAHSAASFSVKHMGVATVRGQLTGIQGAIDLDEAAPERSSVEVPIPIATISTGQQARDNLAGFGARTSIKRADWGLNWNKAIESGGWVVGDEIKIDLDLEAVEAAPVAVPA